MGVSVAVLPNQAASCLDFALEYAARGWPVLPLYTPTNGICDCPDIYKKGVVVRYGGARCPSPGKHPRVEHGKDDASTDESTIRRWWRQFPRANVGIRTGAASGLVVIDVDPRNGGGDSLVELLHKYGQLPETPEAITGGDGRHILFAYPTDGTDIRDAKLGALGYPGIEIKAEGGLIAAAPSQHWTGGTYVWEVSSHPDDVELAAVPPWLPRLLNSERPRADLEDGQDVESGDRRIPLGRDALDFVANGVPIGDQRDRAVRATRNYLGAGYTLEQTVDAICRGLEASPQDDARGRWTQDDIVSLVRNVKASKPKPLRPLSPLLRLNGRSNGAVDPEPPVQQGGDWPAFARSDAGNGELFAHLYGDRVRYDHQRGRWLLWAKHWWQPDQDGAIRRLAKAAVRVRLRRAVEIDDQKAREAEIKWSLGSESRSRLDAMLFQAQSEKPLADSGNGWDADGMLLGVANGVVDLRTGDLRDGEQADRITMHVDVAYDPSAECPRWQRFLEEVFMGDQVLIDYVHYAVGYSVSGNTNEQCLFVCHGRGSNGKSTMLGVLRQVLGDYGHNMPFSALELGARSSIPNDVADLVGRRLVTSSETNESARLNEARIKALTGEDSVSARHLHHEFFTFQPVAKFWLGVNHRPRVSDDSHGFWRRVRLIPFLRQFEGSKVDKRLSDKLLTERVGILAWAVQGCLEWQRRGLDPPSIVVNATSEYQRESDPLSGFLDEACVIDSSASSPARDLYKAYRSWADQQGLSEREQLKNTAFGRRMGDRFGKQHTERGAAYMGVRPTTPTDGFRTELKPSEAAKTAEKPVRNDPADGFGGVVSISADGSDGTGRVFPYEKSFTRKNLEMPSNPSAEVQNPSAGVVDDPSKCRACGGRLGPQDVLAGWGLHYDCTLPFGGPAA
jgi:putative DNA primase/helicase